MAQFRFSVRGRTVELEFERSGKRSILRAEGAELEILPAFVDDHLIHLHIGSRVVPATVARAGRDLFVHVGGETYRFGAADGEDRRDDGNGEKGLAPGTHVVRAPMPGTVARIPAREGERVGIHKPLVILEAMKMENAAAAPADGRVDRIRVKLGDVVNLGDPLVDFVVGP